MNIEEVKAFFEELNQFAPDTLTQNYKNADVDAIFQEYDEDNTGKLERPQMAIFIKKVFKKAKQSA